ncbi:hypothetical protein WJX73_008141 [Symbiochloris irregularis]|uniref:Uncharacterized protein n=1 Tax=Symbiochloris irregularis TaxID=706552 RepID=A0AAW1NUD0_9CHLO
MVDWTAVADYVPAVGWQEAFFASLLTISLVAGIAVLAIRRRRAYAGQQAQVPALGTRPSKLDLESGTGQQIGPGKPASSLGNGKKGPPKLPLLLPVDSSTPDAISAGISSPRSVRGQETVAQAGFYPMRMASLNRLLSIFPSPRKKVAPRSNLGFNGDAAFDGNAQPGRTYSYTWAKIHGLYPESPRCPPSPSPWTQTARMASTVPQSPSPYAIAARLASSLPFNRADAVQGGGEGEADRTDSGMSDMAQTVHPTYFPDDLDANRNWTSEVAPAGMPRIVVRWNSGNGRGSSGDGSLSAGTSARSSTEGGAQGMRRRSTRPSRGTDDWAAQPVPGGTRTYKRSGTLRDGQEALPQVYEEVDLNKQPTRDVPFDPQSTRRAIEDGARPTPSFNPQMNNSRKVTSSLERVRREAFRDKAELPVSHGGRTYRGAAGATSRQMQVVDSNRMAKSASKAEVLVVLRIEEVLPRPAAGLLAKMLRLAPVDTIAVLGCAHPVMVLRPKTQYQISVAVYQANSLGAIEHCNLYLSLPNGQGVDLHLTGQADGDYPDRLWQACTTWNPSDCGLVNAEREDCRTATELSVQVQVACSGGQGSNQYLYAQTALQVKMIGRGSLQHLEDYSMGAAWDQASDVLNAWQLESPTWEGAEFPMLMCPSPDS